MSSFLMSGGGLLVGTTLILGGTNQYLLYDNNGVLGERLGPFPLAGGTIEVWISPSGSDSNPGTFAQPFFTVQHGVNVVSQYDYGGTFSPTVEVLVGTFNLTSTLNLPNLVNTGHPGHLEGDTISTTTLFDINNQGAMLLNGSTAFWTLSDFTIDSSIFHVSAQQGAIAGVSSTLAFANTHGGTPDLQSIQALGAVGISASQITINVSNMHSFALSGGFGCHGFCINNTITISNSVGVSTRGWIDGLNFLSYQFTGNTIVNPSNFVGSQSRAAGGLVTTNNGLLSDFPGVATNNITNNTITIEKSSTGVVAALTEQMSGEPTTTNAFAGTFAIVKDTTNGPRFLAMNDGGTIYVSPIGTNINTQTGASYTLALSDQYGIVEMNNAGANTVTVPTNASVAFPVGTEIRVVQAGAGATTVAAAGGVTGHNFGTLAAQWNDAILYQRAANEWVMALA